MQDMGREMAEFATLVDAGDFERAVPLYIEITGIAADEVEAAANVFETLLPAIRKGFSTGAPEAMTDEQKAALTAIDDRLNAALRTFGA